MLHAERACGRPARGAAFVLSAWICHLRGYGAPVSDPRAAELAAAADGELGEAVRRVLGALDPALADDPVLVAAVVGECEELGCRRNR